MRAALINNLRGSYGTIDNQAIWEKVSRYGLDTLVLDVRQLQPPLMSNAGAKAILDRIRGVYGKKVMVQIVPTDFEPDLTPEAEADLMADFIDGVGYQNTPLEVVFDDERHGSDGILALLKQWRQRKGLRKTIWAPEGMQGGWFTPQLVTVINNDPNLRVARQNYVDVMFPRDPDATRLDLQKAGILPEKIIQYTGAVSSTSPDVKLPLPVGWEGIVFTLEELA